MYMKKSLLALSLTLSAIAPAAFAMTGLVVNSYSQPMSQTTTVPGFVKTVNSGAIGQYDTQIMHDKGVDQFKVDYRKTDGTGCTFIFRQTIPEFGTYNITAVTVEPLSPPKGGLKCSVDSNYTLIISRNY